MLHATGTGSASAISTLQEGTSAATPIVAGAVLLMQELHQRLVGELPTRGQTSGLAATLRAVSRRRLLRRRLCRRQCHSRNRPSATRGCKSIKRCAS